MKALKQFFKHAETYIGIGTAFTFLLIFFCVWMTAYDGVTERMSNLKIGLVNEDVQVGSMLEQQLMMNAMFEMKTFASIDAANRAMNKREIDMVMQIPAVFSEQLQQQEKPAINYFINQANASLAKQMMDGAAKQITQSIVEALQGQPVHANIEKTNNTEGFAATMVPMMLVLASFVGAMIMSLNMNTVALKIRNHYKKWSVFLARQIINAGASILLTCVTLIFLALFHIDLKTSFFEAGVFQLLLYFSFLCLSQMFIILIGPAGMFFNILALSLQLVSSGVIVPRAMLSSFYQIAGSYLPATYAADGYYTIIYGGEGLTDNMLWLLLISVVTIAVATVKVMLERNRVIEDKLPQHAIG